MKLNCRQRWAVKISWALTTELETLASLDALGWHMAEAVQKAQLLPGDRLDIAFSIDQNDHPEFGGWNFAAGR